jgi:hypothetical protein
VTGFVDSGFLLTILTHRSGATKAWELLKNCEIPVGICSLQLFFIRHGLQKNLLDPGAMAEVHEVSVSGIKLLNWLLQQEVIAPVDLELAEIIGLAEVWAANMRTPLPSLLLLWAACAAVSGADSFLSFDPRTRALARSAGLKVRPERL